MKVCRTINIQDDNSNVVTLLPGDTVPEWAVSKITNPKVILVEDEAPSLVESAVEPEPEVGVDYSKVSKPELIALLEARGLPSDGKVAELRDRLAQADASEDTGVDLFDLPREQLEQIAVQRGVAFGPDTSDDELATLIENTEE